MVAPALSDKAVKALKHDGSKGNRLFAVGGCKGLNVQVSPTGAKSWIMRVMVLGKRREIGLGAYPETTLAEARERGITMRNEFDRAVRAGRDPIAERQIQKAAARPTKTQRGPRMMTFHDAVVGFIQSGKLDKLQNAKHRAQWEMTLLTYAVGKAQLGRTAPRGRQLPQGIGANGIGDKLVSDLTKHDIARVLEPIWTTIPETARRLRGRIETVIRWADGKEDRDRENPARWADLKYNGRLHEIGGKAAQEKRPALNELDAPLWFADLRERPGISARALEFLALTAVRSIEARGAVWGEFSDLDGTEPSWVIPAARMKTKKLHVVPLSAQAVTLLRKLPRHHGNELVFVSPRGKMLTPDALGKMIELRHAAELAAGRSGWIDPDSGKVATPHGLRATFRTWTQGQLHWPWHVAEAALAHKISGPTQLSYARSSYLVERRALMQEWADYLTSAKAAQRAAE